MKIKFKTMNVVTYQAALSIDIETMKVNNYVEGQNGIDDKVADSLDLTFITDKGEKLKYQGYVPKFLETPNNYNEKYIFIGVDSSGKAWLPRVEDKSQPFNDDEIVKYLTAWQNYKRDEPENIRILKSYGIELKDE